jgi:hypothetical protein
VDYGNAEMCPKCTENMFIMPNPTQTMLEACDGYSMFASTVLQLTDEKLNISEVAIAFCMDCNVSAIIGPKVSISGTIIDDV